MSKNKIAEVDSASQRFPVVRKIQSSNIIDWLRRGLDDVRQAQFASLFYGIIFACAGILMHTVLFDASWLLSALTTGFLLIGPFLAMGLYDLSRRIELGEKPVLIPSLSAWRANLMNVGIFAGVLVVILLIWARASLVILLYFSRWASYIFWRLFKLSLLLNNPHLPWCILRLAVFAAFVYAVSVVAIPLMADQNRCCYGSYR